jgi:hypothetical protein
MLRSAAVVTVVARAARRVATGEPARSVTADIVRSGRERQRAPRLKDEGLRNA